ncbi:uncharacterized protein LY89DRAFT_714176 [Mollisia scopiformis]|uniref:Uncharacterized protein n=1 Tax=Mollisia scopiformis TaxID=149040 RepID=A0A194XQ88_MOLSC|nr:uncharacterized protein LY89DRAFT_714176 [Mollisia scopiformis]KUJ22358.1 hypothetical protein LY89DRAFT_714176 [Mollisia scopiformis]
MALASGAEQGKARGKRQQTEMIWHRADAAELGIPPSTGWACCLVTIAFWHWHLIHSVRIRPYSLLVGSTLTSPKRAFQEVRPKVPARHIEQSHIAIAIDTWTFFRNMGKANSTNATYGGPIFRHHRSRATLRLPACVERGNAGERQNGKERQVMQFQIRPPEVIEGYAAACSRRLTWAKLARASVEYAVPVRLEERRLACGSDHSRRTGLLYPTVA